MKLLFLEQQPRFIGGSERMSLALCRHSITRGHSASLVYAENGDMVAAYSAAGAAVSQLPVFPLAARRPIAAWRSIRHLAGLVRRESIDWMFTSQVSFVSLLATVGRMTGAGTVVHLGLVYDFPSPLFRFGRDRIRLGVAPSVHTAAGWIKRGWPAASLRVIPNGVDTGIFNSAIDRMASRHSLGIPDDAQPLVAYVGRLVREKGIFTLLRAFAAHRGSTGTGRLLLAGYAPGDEVLALGRLAAELSLPGEAWQVRPPTSQPEAIYRAADIVVVPSEWDEAFGLVPLEAMASGALAIVSDRGVLPEFVSPVGEACVFPVGNAPALAARLTRWLGDSPAREAAAARLAQNARENHGFVRCGDAYLEAFAALRPA